MFTVGNLSSRAKSSFVTPASNIVGGHFSEEIAGTFPCIFAIAAFGKPCAMRPDRCDILAQIDIHYVLSGSKTVTGVSTADVNPGTFP